MTHLRNKLVTLYISKLASLIQLGQVISLHNPLAIQVVYARFPEEEGFTRITCPRLRNHVLNIASLPALHKEGFIWVCRLASIDIFVILLSIITSTQYE